MFQCVGGRWQTDFIQDSYSKAVVNLLIKEALPELLHNLQMLTIEGAKYHVEVNNLTMFNVLSFKSNILSGDPI